MDSQRSHTQLPKDDQSPGVGYSPFPQKRPQKNSKPNQNKHHKNHETTKPNKNPNQPNKQNLPIKLTLPKIGKYVS